MTTQEQAAFDLMREALEHVVAFWDRLNFDGSAINNIHTEAREALAAANAVKPQAQEPAWRTNGGIPRFKPKENPNA